MNDLSLFKKKLERKLKDRELAEATFNFYNRTTEEIAMMIFFKNVSEETSKESELIYKHSFLYSNHTYMEHYYNEIEKKVIELSFFTCFKYALTKHLDDITKDHQLSDEELKNIEDKKESLFSLFDKRNDVLKKEYTFLKMKKNRCANTFVEICMLAFFLLSGSVAIENGTFPFFISLATLIAVHLTITKATGQHFEKIKFRKRLMQIFPSKIQRGINAISILYLIGLAISVLTSFLVLFSFFYGQSQGYVLVDYPITYMLIISILQALTSVWFFFDGVFEKRYFLFKRFELKHTFEEKETFLEFVRPSKKI